MIVALLTMLFVGGGTDNAIIEFWESREGKLEQVIVDEDRRKAAVLIVKRIEERARESVRSSNKAKEHILPYLEDTGGSSADLEALTSDFLASRAQYDADMIDLRFELLDELTREEWEALFDQ